MGPQPSESVQRSERKQSGKCFVSEAFAMTAEDEFWSSSLGSFVRSG